MRLLLLVFFVAIGLRNGEAQISCRIPPRARQLVLVTAPTWKSSRGNLQRFERADAGNPWRKVGERRDVVLGENGLAWGLGRDASPPADAVAVKREGDRRSPAGVFELPAAFGAAPRTLKLPYRRIVAGTEAVDDPNSRFYNRIVQRAEIRAPDWHSSERMNEIRDYDLGIVVAHNPRSVPNAGSCIFIHLWRGERNGTAGCTVLREPDLRELVAWLDARKFPVLMQLPVPELPPELR